MSAVTAIVLADAQGTPVNHTFTPLGPDTNGVWWYEDQSQSTPVGFWRISLQLIRTPPAGNGVASSSNRVNRVKVGFHLPVLETLGTNDAGTTPPPTVSYVNRCTCDFILPERDTLQNRKDIRKMFALLLADTQVVGMVETLQNVY
jgi:hypothetical protein